MHQAIRVLEHALQAMLGQHHGDVPLPVQAHQRAEEGVRRLGIQLRGGLVQHQDGRAERQRRGERDALLLPAGQVVHQPLAQGEQIQPGQRFVHALVHLLRRHAPLLQRQGDLLLDALDDELRLRILEDQAHPAGQHRRPFAEGVVPGDAHGAGTATAGEVRHQAVQRAQQRGLAGARASSHQHEFSRADVQRDVAQDGLRGAGIPVGQVGDVDHGCLWPAASAAGTSRPSRSRASRGCTAGAMSAG